MDIFWRRKKFKKVTNFVTFRDPKIVPKGQFLSQVEIVKKWQFCQFLSIFTKKRSIFDLEKWWKKWQKSSLFLMKKWWKKWQNMTLFLFNFDKIISASEIIFLSWWISSHHFDKIISSSWNYFRHNQFDKIYFVEMKSFIINMIVFDEVKLISPSW